MTFNAAAAPGALPGSTARAPASGDVAAPGSQRNSELVVRAVATLQSTASGREVAEFLQHEHIKVQVVPDDEYARRFPGSGASYDAKTKVITTPRGSLLPTTEGATTLAHEGQHALDFRHRPPWYIDTIGKFAGTSSDALKALITFRNPMTAWLDSLTARQNGFEVSAYRRQAAVARDLGLNQQPWAHGQERDGSVRSEEETRAAIAASDLYRMTPVHRLALGGGLGLAITGAAGLSIGALASRFAKGSFLATKPWPVYAVCGALTAVWLLADQIRAHRLEGQRAEQTALTR